MSSTRLFLLKTCYMHPHDLTRLWDEFFLPMTLLYYKYHCNKYLGESNSTILHTDCKMVNVINKRPKVTFIKI